MEGARKARSTAGTPARGAAAGGGEAAAAPGAPARRRWVHSDEWEAVWSELERKGWRQEQAASQGTAKFYFPPGVTRENGKKRRDYFDSKTLVLAHLSATGGRLAGCPRSGGRPSGKKEAAIPRTRPRSPPIMWGEPPGAEKRPTTGQKIVYKFVYTSKGPDGESWESWELGTVRSALAAWPDWYTILFDDGQQLDVLLDEPGRGKVWRWAEKRRARAPGSAAAPDKQKRSTKAKQQPSQSNRGSRAKASPLPSAKDSVQEGPVAPSNGTVAIRGRPFSVGANGRPYKQSCKECQQTPNSRSCEGRSFLVCTRLQCGVTEGADPALTICNRFCSKCLVDKHGMQLDTIDAATFVCPDCDSALRDERSSSAMQLLAEVRFLTEILDDFRRFVDEIWRF